MFLRLETVLKNHVPVYLFILVRMVPVTEAMGVKLCCPEEGRFAFFNSPFPPHKLNSGVDLYPGPEFGENAYSPVAGEVSLIRKVKAPSGHGFEAADHDTVIVIRNKVNPSTVTKLLHADPHVKVGDSVQVGDVIGTTLRSGYYGWGTSAHLHAEIRKPDDAIRARGGFNLKRVDSSVGEPLENFVGEVVATRPEYTFLRLPTPVTGLVGSVGGKPALLDGGIPYYGWMGAHLEDPTEYGEIQLMGETIGMVTDTFDGSCKADCTDFSFTVNDSPILGLSLTIQPRKEALVKVLPRKRGSLSPSIGDWLDVKMNV